MPEEPLPSYERIADAGEVFYSIFSERERDMIHLSPEQLLDLRDWVNRNERDIRKDAANQTS